MITRIAQILFPILMALFSCFAGADPALDLNPEQMKRANELKREIMAPCCWHGTVDSHNSPEAQRIAQSIDAMVAMGTSSDSILDKMVAQHGERILARPRRSGFGLVFYAGPTILVAVGVILLTRWLRRNTQATAHVQSTLQSPELRPASPLVHSSLDQRFEELLRSRD